MDFKILVALRSRERYDNFSRFIKRTSLSEEAWTLFAGMGEWLKANPNAQEVDWKAYAAWFVLVRHVKMDKAKLAVHKELLKRLEEYKDVDEEGMLPLLQGLQKRDYAAQIAEQALRIADGDYSLSFEGIQGLLDQASTALGRMGEETKALGSFELDELRSVASAGLEWRLHALRESAGDIRQGDFIIFGKRPDTGGTTFLASESTYMAEQLEEEVDVLFFNNEEQGNKVRRRIVQSATGTPSALMEANLPKVLQEYTARMGRIDKIKVYDKPQIHIRDVERLCKKHKPGLIVFDQLRKFHGFEQESEVMRLELLFNWAREIAKEYAPVIAVHQAGGDAENVKYITMDMLYGAKTGPQGEADLIITMGRTVTGGDSRYLYIPKNKLLTPGNPARRNGKWEILIDADRARFKEPYVKGD